MKKVILILPYFGKFPSIFPLFLKTVKSNPEVNFLIITDGNWSYGNIENVRVLNEGFNEFRKRFTDKLGKNISLKTPYKLCDFKPTYGYVLKEYIKGYDYWGHCDCDLIFGNLKTVLSPLLEENYDKLFAAGHLTLYRNIEDVNQLFYAIEETRYLFDEVSQSDEIWGYDEDFFGQYNIHDLFLKSGLKVYAEDFSINPAVSFSKFVLKKYSPETRGFEDEPYQNAQYYWDDGHLFQVYKEQGEIHSVEKAYMHFQMRNMKFDTQLLSASKFKIVPNRFIAGKTRPCNIEEWEKERKFYFNHHKIDLLKKRIKNKIKGNGIHVHQHNNTGI